MVLAQIIVGIALLAVLATSLSLSSRGTGFHQMRIAVDAEISSQANLIRQRVIECNLRYPTPGFPTTPVSGLVRDLRCPGAPNGYQILWNSPNNPSLPKPPTNHNEWTYVADSAGIRITTAALASYATNADLLGGQYTAWRRFHSSEADCNQSSGTASVTIWIQKTGSAPPPVAC